MNELIKAFNDAFTQRVKNPFVIAFALAWIGFNWQLLAILFLSNEPISSRFELIHQFYGDWRQLSVYPLIVSVFYLALMPWIALVASRIQSAPNIRRKTFQIDQEKLIVESRLSLMQSELQLDQLRLEQELEQERKRQELTRMQENDKLAIQRNDLSAELGELNSDLENQAVKRDAISAEYKKMLKTIEESKTKIAQVEAKAEGLENLQAQVRDLEVRRDRLAEEIVSLKDEIELLEGNKERFNQGDQPSQNADTE